jgi:hypothetical protein
MKNIIVTTPKTEINNAAKEAEECINNGGGYYFRTLSRMPKDIEPHKSKIYYVEDGYIRGCCTIFGVSKGDKQCEVTGKTWGNDNSIKVWMLANTWQWIKPIEMKGFQGWRYFDDNGVEVIGDWKDPKPNIN